MKKNKTLTIAARSFFCAAWSAALLLSPLLAQEDQAWKDENAVIEDDTGGPESGTPTDLLNSGDAKRLLQLVDNLRKNSHSFGGFYSRVPAHRWINDRYDGFARNSFRVGDSYRLGVNLSYEQSNNFRDKNFPDRLYNASGSVTFSGERFFIYGGAANRSDRLFSGFGDINLSAAALGTVYRSGRHGVVFGGVFSYRGDLWKFPSPLPVLAYRYVDKNIIVFAGFPFFMAWRPSKWFMMTLAGYLPGVGRAVFTFKPTDIFSIALEYSHRKDTYNLNSYPFHDERYFTHQARTLAGRKEGSAMFVLESNETGVRFTLRPVDELTMFAYAGMRFKPSYYLTKNILSKPAHRDWIASSLVVSAGASFLFHSGGPNGQDLGN